MDETPKRRWYRYGEPWGLLSKTNPKATFWSLVWQAIVGAISVTVAYGLVLYFRAEPTEAWQMKLAFCAVLGGSIGALFEWQDGGDTSLLPPDETSTLDDERVDRF